MPDIVQYFNVLLNENLLIAIPVIMVTIILVVILVPYFRSLIKDKKEAIKENKKNLKEKINFHEEFNKVSKIGDPNIATTKLFLLINKFLSQLFKLEHAFTYEEIKKETKVYGFLEIVGLCDMLSNLTFAKNTYSTADFKELSKTFEKVLNSYEYVILEDHKLGLKRNTINFKVPLKIKNNVKSFFMHLKGFFYSIDLRLTPSSVSFKEVWVKLSPAIKQVQIKQLEKNLLLKHSHLFNAKIEKQQVAHIKDKKIEILRLIKLGQTEVKKGDNLSASTIYNSIVFLFNSLNTQEREPLADQVNELYINVLNLIGLKASYELIDKVANAIVSKDYNSARESFHNLKYVYARLSPEVGREVYSRWVQKFGKY